MKQILPVIFMLFAVNSQAGIISSGGEPLRPFFPNEDFVYKCEARLEEPQPKTPDQEITDTFSYVSVQDFEFNNGNARAAITLPESSWRHLKVYNRPGNNTEPVSQAMIPYPLKGHFTQIGFENGDSGAVVSLRANLILNSRSGISAWALADFSSKHIDARVDTENPIDGSSLQFRVSCLRTK